MEVEQRRKIISLFSELMSEAINVAYENQLLLQRGNSLLPELQSKAANVCNYIQLELAEHFEKEAEPSTLATRRQTTGRFCLLAGMGAFVLWNNDNHAFREKGIVPLLTEPKGIEKMDQYIYELIGMTTDSDERRHLNVATTRLFDHLHARATEKVRHEIAVPHSELDTIAPLIQLEVCKLMYRIGITIQSQHSATPAKQSTEASSEQLKLEETYSQWQAALQPTLANQDFLDAFTPTLVQQAFQSLPHLHLAPTYQFDVYTLSNIMKEGEDCRQRISQSLSCDEKHIYVHQVKTIAEFLPTIEDPAQKTTFLQKLFGKKPENLRFVNTIYQDNLQIRMPLFLSDNLYSIPSPLEYVTCDWNAQCAWEFFLFATLVKQSIYPILFSLDDLKCRRPELFTGDGDFSLADETLHTLRNLHFSPQIKLDRSVARITCYQLRLGGITKVEATLIFKKDKFFLPSFKDSFAVSFIAQVKDQERLRLLLERRPYSY